MKTTTLLAIVAAATLGYATPVPEKQAEAGEAGTAEKACGTGGCGSSSSSSGGGITVGGSGSGAGKITVGGSSSSSSGGWGWGPAPHPAYPPPPPRGGGWGYPPPPPVYPPPPPSGPPSWGWGYPPPPPSPPSCDEPWCRALPPPPAHIQAWPIDNFPDGSLLNGGGLQQAGNTCSASNQGVSCCNGDTDSSGLVGGVLDSGSCGNNLLGDQCKQSVACCPTDGSGGIITIGGLCNLLDL